MRVERIVRYGGIALFLLFPLISVFQLRDGSASWREAALRARPAILGLYRLGADEKPRFVACGVVIQQVPRRLVVPGRVESGPFATRHAQAWLGWRALHTDVHGEFTILGPDPASTTPEARLAAAQLLLDPEGDVQPDVAVALVPPQELEEEPLWVGVLTAAATTDGRPGYFSSFLEPLSASYALPTAEAFAAEPREIDPALRGAPFVDADGSVVAIYLGRTLNGTRALPVEVVAQTLLMLQLQATK
ncbi:MAG: hypothetical protein JSW67_05500 [Candidatus Latescibacterota bacterium]|nr:MAG: hypothetical protein JSW67_05500 [Candidatus Latescibacterota bacterium]